MTDRTAITDTVFENELQKTVLEMAAIPATLTRLLFNRGFHTSEELKNYLYPDDHFLHSPLEMKDMGKAVCRIEKALKEHEQILIYGDYDADGVTSTALLYHYFRSRGCVPYCHIPERLGDGYGLNVETIERLAHENPKIKLMVTVDTGCTAEKEIAYASSIGIETVVTDHHDCCGNLPVCAAVVNPMQSDCHYPFKGLAGVGVAFKLVCALEMSKVPTESEKSVALRIFDQYADLLVLGTIADVMPLRDENRYLVKQGLKKLSGTKLPGLSALISLSAGERGIRRELDASFVGFGLAPKINAAGRMDTPNRALQLLITCSVEEGRDIAQKLFSLNNLRKSEEERIMKEVETILQSGDFSNDSVLVLSKEGWHKGVVGIVAARVCERYKKSTVLIALDGEEGRGSGRAVKGINLTELFAECADLLEKFGGHELAAGLSIRKENIECFRKRINALAENSDKAFGSIFGTETEMTLSACDMTLPFAQSLRLMEPCGNGNPVPVFFAEEMKVVNLIALSEGKHSRMTLEKDGICFTALFFGKSPFSLPFCVEDTVDIVFELSVNEYSGRQSLQIKLKEAMPSGKTLALQKEDEASYRRISEALKTPESDLIYKIAPPTREECGRVYRVLKGAEERRMQTLSYGFITRECFGNISTVKTRLILDIFEQAELIFMKQGEYKDTFYFELRKEGRKIDLARSSVFRGLQRYKER